MQQISKYVLRKVAKMRGRCRCDCYAQIRLTE